MKRLKMSLFLAVIVTVIIGQAMPGAGAATKVSGSLTLPDYAQIDSDVKADMAAAGVAVQGKEFKGYNPGHSYKSPGDGVSIGNLDMTGHGRKGLAILVDWPAETAGKISDVPGVDYAQLDQSLFNDLLNGDSYNPFVVAPFAGKPEYNRPDLPLNLTMKNYYDEVSYGKFGINVDVVGWVTLPHNYDYYLGQNKGFYNDNGDTFVGELVKDAIAGADAMGIDFSQYAVPAKAGDFADLYGNATSFTDDNGQAVSMIVPNLFIIHRGTGAEYSADPHVIWSHKWDILSAGYYGQYYQTGVEPPLSSLRYLTVDGVALNTYNIVPEVGQDITEYLTGPAGLPKRPPSPPYAGTFAHEFGHVLGAPDLYDYGYDSEGVGMFSLMAAGSWGRSIQNRYFSGNSPVHMDAFTKHYLGFLPFQELTPSTTVQTITLPPVESSPVAYRVQIPGSDGREYFLLENRQQTGFDKGLAYVADTNPTALHGLVVYQVDENVLARNFWRPNEAGNYDWNKRGDNFRAATGENHYAVAVVQADGKYHMEHYFNDGDAGDVFPGKLNITQLLPEPKAGRPNTVSWLQWTNDRTTGITLSNIRESADGTITLDVSLKPAK